MPAAGTLTTSQITNAIDRRVRKHFKDEYKRYQPTYEKIFQIKDQEDFNEYEQDYQQFGLYETTAEGELYKHDQFAEAYQTIYTPSKKTKRVDFTWEARKWDKSKLTSAGNIGKAFATASRETIELDAASVFHNGHDTSFTSYGDSKPLFSTDHTRPDGGAAQSNASASSIAFGDESLETAINEMRAQTDKRGLLVNVTPYCLLVPPALEGDARRVTGSKLRSGVSDNDANIYNMKEYKGGSLEVKVWEHLSAAQGGSDTAWYLLDNDHMITWKWSQKPMMEKDPNTGVQSGVTWFLGMFDASFGWSDWVGTWGSKGDGTAYSD